MARARVHAKAPPLFSVVVPVLRPPRWAIERCVASVLAQSFPDFQLVLADDASRDRSLEEQLRSFARLDPRVEVVLREETRRHLGCHQLGARAGEGHLRRVLGPRRRAPSRGAREDGGGDRGQPRGRRPLLRRGQVERRRASAASRASSRTGRPTCCSRAAPTSATCSSSGARSSTSSAGCAPSSTGARTTT